MGKNVIIFEVDMSSSEHVHNMGQYILILREEATRGLHDTGLTAEAKDPINFTQSGKRLAICIMPSTAPYLLMLQKSISSQQKTKRLCIVVR